MCHDEFFLLVNTRLANIQQTLLTKGQHYATDDLLHNFKTQILDSKENPMEVCWGYLRKHISYVVDMAKGVKPITKELIDEKIGDSLVYLILMEALMTEKLQTQESSSCHKTLGEVEYDIGGSD